MIQLDYAFLCERVEVDSNDKTNAYGVGVDVVRPSYPAQMPPLMLVFATRVSLHECEKEHTLAIDFLSEHGPVVSDVMRGTFTPPRRYSDPFVDVKFEESLLLQGLVIPALGEYELVIRVDDHEIGRVPFRAWVEGEFV